MIRSTKLLSIIILLLFLFSCKNDKTSSKSEIFANLELNRGDLLLCGDPNFGEVSFSLSCRYDLREKFNLGPQVISKEVAENSVYSTYYFCFFLK